MSLLYVYVPAARGRTKQAEEDRKKKTAERGQEEQTEQDWQEGQAERGRLKMTGKTGPPKQVCHQECETELPGQSGHYSQGSHDRRDRQNGTG
jgi:hypothetical protein